MMRHNQNYSEYTSDDYVPDVEIKLADKFTVLYVMQFAAFIAIFIAALVYSF